MRIALRDQIGSISHRSTQFQSIYSETEASLRELIQIPKNFKVLFFSSATEIWERSIQNLLANKSHHFINGAFSKRFFEFAQDFGKNSTHTTVPDGETFGDLTIPEDTEMICVNQNETSIGYQFDKTALGTIRSTHPDKLIAVDSVSCMPAVPTDFSLLDLTYFSVQKCFGMPAGLGVLIINEKAIEVFKKIKAQGQITGAYRSFDTMLKYAEKHQTPETPNVLSIYLLGKIAQELIARGVKNVQNETIYKSSILYQTIEDHPLLSPFVSNKLNRSKTVAVLNTGKHQKKVLDAIEKQGMILGKGYGQHKENHIRIANFPSHSKEQVELLCDLLAKI